MPTVYILQGLPGSGKSTWVTRMGTLDPYVVSADDYFMVDVDGGKRQEYRFDPSKIGLAHEQCMERFAAAIVRQAALRFPVVVVDNTNTTCVEMAPYYLLARSQGYDVFFVRFPCDPEVAAVRNTHGAPLATCQAMAAAMEEPKPYWTGRCITVSSASAAYQPTETTG